jgi:hypothetical protein
MNTIKNLAKEFYFRDVLREDWRNNFLIELQKRNVTDKRSNGYHCLYCQKFSEKEIAFPEIDRAVFPKKNNEEIWIVNSHYDGCQGWD